MIPDKVKEFIDTAELAIGIANSDASWEMKYGLIFSEEVSIKMHRTGLTPDYYDPDADYEDDVIAFIRAIEATTDELKKAFHQ